MVLICIDELGPIARHFGLRRSCIFFGPVQGDLDVLNIRIEDSIEVPWQCGADNLKLLRPLLRRRVEHMNKRSTIVKELVYEALPQRYLVLFSAGRLLLLVKNSRLGMLYLR